MLSGGFGTAGFSCELALSVLILRQFGDHILGLEKSLSLFWLLLRTLIFLLEGILEMLGVLWLVIERLLYPNILLFGDTWLKVPFMWSWCSLENIRSFFPFKKGITLMRGEYIILAITSFLLLHSACFTMLAAILLYSLAPLVDWRTLVSPGHTYTGGHLCRSFEGYGRWWEPPAVYCWDMLRVFPLLESSDCCLNIGSFLLMGDRNGDCEMRGMEDTLMRLKQWPGD